MKYARRYIVFTIILILLAVSRMVDFSSVGTAIAEFRGASIVKEDFVPLMAAHINGNDITLTVGGRTYTSDRDGLYANADARIMMPIYVLRDAMNTSARLYNGESLILHKRDMEIINTIGEKKAYINDDLAKNLKTKTEIVDGQVYVCAQDMASLLDYEWEWNVDDQKAVLVDNQQELSFLPVRFDLREQVRTSQVEDQGEIGTCWAFATLTSLESSLRPEEFNEFAEDHLSLLNGYDLDQDAGGGYTMAMAYLTAWKGPVYEKDDPYGDGKTNSSLRAVKHVQEVQLLNAGDLTSIKAAVFKYGGVQSSIYNSLEYEDEEDSKYYNSETHAYCYQGTEKSNHEVVIVGWDDSYPAENFLNPPETDGAFICQNSWGKNFGEDGFFYISYTDSNIAINSVVYTRVDDVDNYDNIYQSDICGCVGYVGFESENIYAANIYTAKKNETLRACGFYTTAPGTSYEVYVIPEFDGVSSLSVSNRINVARGTLANQGFYTIDFDKAIKVEKGKKFAVLIYLNSPGAAYPMAVEYQADEATKSVDITDGEGYISMQGETWKSVEEKSEGNLCLKVYTDDIEE